MGIAAQKLCMCDNSDYPGPISLQNLNHLSGPFWLRDVNAPPRRAERFFATNPPTHKARLPVAKQGEARPKEGGIAGLPYRPFRTEVRFTAELSKSFYLRSEFLSSAS